MFKLASLFVEIKAQDDALQKQVGGLHGQLSAMSVAIGTAAGGLALSAIQAAGSAITGFFAKGIAGAVELEDSISAIGVIFGESSGFITRQADEMAAKFGVVKGEWINAASAFGSVFKGSGSAQKDAAEMGNTLAKLGIDLASFATGATNEQAFGALQAALRGEFDPLEKFNVFLSAAAIEQEALSSGLVKRAKDLDEASKKQATFNLIMKKTQDQQGDLERTADSSKNAWTKLTGTLTNLATDIGTSLAPAIKEIVNVGAEMAANLAAGFEASKTTFTAFAEGVAEGARVVGVLWRNLGDSWEIVTIKAQEMAHNTISVISTIGDNIGVIAGYIGRNWYQLVTDGVTATWTVFKNFGENVHELGRAIAEWFSNPAGGLNVNFKPLLEGFTATAEKFPALLAPELLSMQGQIDAVGQRIADRESRRAQELADKQAAAQKAVDKAAQQTAAAAAKKEKEFKSELIDSGDFAAKLRASIFGGDDTAKQQLTAQKQTAENTKKIAEAAGKPALAVLG